MSDDGVDAGCGTAVSSVTGRSGATGVRSRRAVSVPNGDHGAARRNPAACSRPRARARGHARSAPRSASARRSDGTGRHKCKERSVPARPRRVVTRRHDARATRDDAPASPPPRRSSRAGPHRHARRRRSTGTHRRARVTRSRMRSGAARRERAARGGRSGCSSARTIAPAPGSRQDGACLVARAATHAFSFAQTKKSRLIAARMMPAPRSSITPPATRWSSSADHGAVGGASSYSR